MKLKTRKAPAPGAPTPTPVPLRYSVDRAHGEVGISHRLQTPHIYDYITVANGPECSVCGTIRATASSTNCAVLSRYTFVTEAELIEMLACLQSDIMDLADVAGL